MTACRNAPVAFMAIFVVLNVYGRISTPQQSEATVIQCCEKSEEGVFSVGDKFNLGAPAQVAPDGNARDYRVLRMEARQFHDDYYNETLSVIPAMMFSPAALQLAFFQTVDMPIDEHGNTLLHVASKAGDIFSAWQLLELGASSQIANKFQKRPLDVINSVNVQVSESLAEAFTSNENKAIAEVMRRRAPSGSVSKVQLPPADSSPDLIHSANISLGANVPGSQPACDCATNG